jgi:predicted PurR-regulated permease PerM
MQPIARPDLTRIFLVILIIALLIAGSLWTLFPFLGALIWATTIVIATWPLLLKVERWTGGRRSVATALLTIVMLAIFIVPFGLAIGVLLESASEGVELVKNLAAQGLSPPPSWVPKVHVVGSKLAERWQELAAGGPEAITDFLRPYARSAANWVVSVTGGLGGTALHFLLTIVIAAILYANGEGDEGSWHSRIGSAGERGERTIRLAGQSIRGVALGVIVTALVESIIAGLGLWPVVPHTALPRRAHFRVRRRSVGPATRFSSCLSSGCSGPETLWGVIIAVFTVAVAVVDNVLKPVLIRRGVDLPLLLIVAGVIGGLIGFGVIGLFIGPVILAVTYTLLDAWVNDSAPSGADSPGSHGV